jgi:hypothetical protein
VTAYFSRSAPFVKTPREWASRPRRRSVDTAASAYARQNMVAVVLLANDDAVGYFYDVGNDRVARVPYRNVEWVA